MSMMKRSVINPALVISGGLVLLSGFFLMFHFESHFAKAIHQICGILLIIFGIMHIILNRRALTGSLKGRLSVWTVAVIFAVSVLIMGVSGKYVPHQHSSALNAKTAGSEQRSFNAFLQEDKVNVK